MLPCAHLHLRPTAPKKPRNACVGPPPRPGGRATALQHRKLTSTRLVNSLWHQTHKSTIAGRDAQSDSECLVILLWFIRLCAPLCPCLALSDSRAPVGPLGLHNFPHSHRVVLPPPSTFWNSERQGERPSVVRYTYPGASVTSTIVCDLDHDDYHQFPDSNVKAPRGTPSISTSLVPRSAPVHRCARRAVQNAYGDWDGDG